jgi:hypothetical protein
MGMSVGGDRVKKRYFGLLVSVRLGGHDAKSFLRWWLVVLFAALDGELDFL